MTLRHIWASRIGLALYFGTSNNFLTSTSFKEEKSSHSDRMGVLLVEFGLGGS